MILSVSPRGTGDPGASMSMQSPDHLDPDSHESLLEGHAHRGMTAIPEDEEDYASHFEDDEEPLEDDGEDDWFYDEDKERAAGDEDDDEDEEEAL